MYSAFTAYNSQQPQIPTSITSIDKSTLHYYDTSELDYDRSIPEVVREDSNFSNYTFTENEDLIKYNQIRNSVYTYEEFIAVIQLRSPSENVGFSIGQNDDDLPYIEEITEESPAARANLITSDEIIEVNSIPVTSLGYYETIDLIRDSIDSCIIQLRIRRKLSMKRVPLATTESQVASTLFIEDRTPSERTETSSPSMSNSLPPISPGQWDRVKEYQDDLRRRQESTIKKEQQENFFRTSLRASKKLQALKNTSNGLAADFDKHCVLVEEKECHFGYSNKCYSPTSSTPRQSLSDLHDDTDSPKKDFAAHVGTISSIVSTEKGESNLMVVKIFKPEDDSYLGATVKNEGNRVLIGRIIQGGICEKTKSLVEGDELIEVNGRDLRGQSVNEVSDMLRRCHGDIIFIILPSPSRNLSHQNHSKDGSFSSDGSVQNVLRTKAPAPVIHHIRALFDYDPEDDYFVPCRELALKFQRGDILHVISKKDENWWQAYREDDFTSRGRDKNSVGDTNQQLAGLIPSSSFQKQVELYNREVDRKAVNDDQRGRSKGIFGCHNKKEGPTLKKKKKGVNMVTIQDEECSEEEVLTYEDVCLYLSRSGRKRPVVLIGPEGVGCLELRQKLIESDKNRYGSAVPHTTRPQKGNERDGLDFHFTSKQKFLEDSKNGMFVEYGEFQKFFYGTSVTAVQNVVQQSKTCLLTLRPESLAQLRKSDLMPYVVFIAPPALMQLKRQKEMLGMYGVKDEELKQILNEGKRMEQCYGHMFDHIIVNIEYQRSLSELKEMITKLDTEPQWVSNSWLTDKVNSFKGGQVNGRGRITSFFEEGKIPI